MSEQEASEMGDEDSAGRPASSSSYGGADARADAGPADVAVLLPVPFRPAATFRTERLVDPAAAPAKRSAPRRIAWGAAIATLGMVAGGTLAGGALLALNDHRSQAGLIAEQARQTQALAKSIDELSARLNATEGARSHDELVELRRSMGEIRSSLASSRDLGAALDKLAQRVEKLDKEESAKVDRLNERGDRETGAQTAELAARVDKLEKKVVASVAPAPPPPPPKQPPQPPKFGPNVSMEPTGSIEPPRPVLRGYIVLGARGDTAIVEGRFGERAVQPGDFLPGAGRVEQIKREGGAWVVLTERGLIPAAEEAY